MMVWGLMRIIYLGKMRWLIGWGYFSGDYRPINNSTLSNNQSHFAGLSGPELFNGNISAMETYIPNFNTTGRSKQWSTKEDF